MINIKELCKTDSERLRNKLKENGLNSEKIRAEMDLCRTSMSLRMNNKEKFLQGEIKYIKDRLKLSNDEVVEIFFN